MLGAQIAALRKAQGKSQKELAAQLGISPSAVGMYEQGRREPSLELLIRMAECLQVTVDQLITGRPAAPEQEADWEKKMAAAFAGAELEDAAGARRPVSAADVALLTAALPDVDEMMMREALRLAEEAAAEGEVPVGCVITCGGRIVGRGRNRRERGRHALAHAEIEAIDQACRTLGGWRLWECTLYVTLEPCPMCAGAILNARIPRVVYGARDPKAGSCGSVCDLFCMSYNHHPVAEQGLLEADCAAALQQFFRRLRQARKRRKSAGFPQEELT